MLVDVTLYAKPRPATGRHRPRCGPPGFRQQASPRMWGSAAVAPVTSEFRYRSRRRGPRMPSPVIGSWRLRRGSERSLSEARLPGVQSLRRLRLHVGCRATATQDCSGPRTPWGYRFVQDRQPSAGFAQAHPPNVLWRAYPPLFSRGARWQTRRQAMPDQVACRRIFGPEPQHQPSAGHYARVPPRSPPGYSTVKLA
jgi:hypothetical protein